MSKLTRSSNIYFYIFQDKWIPLHTLAASGEFYLVDKLLKYNAQINSVDKVHIFLLCSSLEVSYCLMIFSIFQIFFS